MGVIHTMDPFKPVTRWTCWRKQLLVEAFDVGKISAKDIKLIHNISLDELNEWRRRNGCGGEEGRRRLRAGDKEALATRELAVRKDNPKLRGRVGKVGRKRKPVVIDVVQPPVNHVEIAEPPDVFKSNGAVPKIPPNSYQVRVSLVGKPDLIFDFTGPGSKQRMTNWLAMYKSNAIHNDSITAVTAIGTSGKLIERWQR